MDTGIMIGSDCADWWDEQLKNYKVELEEYVMENPSYWGIGVATVTATGADVAHMFFVDLIRLGEGAAEGTVSGVVRDIFRVLTFIPETKITRVTEVIPKSFFGRVVQTATNLFHWRNLDGGLCVPITVAQALQRTGNKLAVSLRAIAEAAGESLAVIEQSGLSPDRIAGVLERLGVEFTAINRGTVNTWDDIVRLAQRSDGPIMVGLRGVRNQVDEFHRILVGKTAGGVKIIDRSGVANGLDDLSTRYGMDGLWQLNTNSPMLLIENAVIDLSSLELVQRFGILASLTRMSFGIFDFNRAQVTAEFVKHKFEEFVAECRGTEALVKGKDIHVVGGKTVTVTAGDPARSTLSGIAKAEYGTFDLWPLIYDLNQNEIGPNPNKLKPGLPLLVLPLSAYDAQEIAAAKLRAPTWKNYS